MRDLRPKAGNIRLLSRQIGCDYIYLWRVLSGIRTPSVPFAHRIEAATGGLIRWHDFFDGAHAS